MALGLIGLVNKFKTNKDPTGICQSGLLKAKLFERFYTAFLRFEPIKPINGTPINQIAAGKGTALGALKLETVVVAAPNTESSEFALKPNTFPVSTLKDTVPD